ncbi:protein MAIN-LIKE 1-like [Arachis ipaensis]|uniref:protein MAIN-LIKE 1-like n=1 Tax=Arachis ipaensis TaxID=130454 RepID=UPI0007AF527C|nr:protein MAIN-LIKE 1-like [Arachis ipaensis]XP_025636139.1 protein MAIN-LIKE 1-like [Arachis hypogaea]
MITTLQDVAYQVGLRIDGDPVSGCIGRWEKHHDGRSIEDLCQQLLGVVPSPEDRQSQTKWTVKFTWFHNTVCGELEQDATEERLLQYMSRYIMQVIDGILFPDASNSRMCHATEYSQYNLGGCVNLLLSWAYHHIPLLRLDGFETRRFPLVKRWIEYHPDNAKGENRLRHYRLTLNGISILNVD